MKEYKELIERVYNNGKPTSDRTGVGTRYVFGESMKVDLREQFPVLTLRKLDYRQGFGELAAFIKGYTTKSQFRAEGCNYWNTTPGFKFDDNLGPIYGAQWRNWQGQKFKTDQLGQLLAGLSSNPQSRRHILSTWNVEEIGIMALPPCHVLAQFDVSQEDGKLSCIVYMRSVDLMLGLPYDVVVYALLTHLIAEELNFKVGTLQFMFGNTHIYNNHLGLVPELLSRVPIEGTQLVLHTEPTHNRYYSDIFNFHQWGASLINYAPHPVIKFPLNL